MSEAGQWARVRVDVNCNVRRGAWYEVVKLTPDAAVLDIGRGFLTVARSSLQIVPLRPLRWSIVPRPQNAVRIPPTWGSRYAVCPNCSQRTSLGGQPTELQCPKCNGVFAVAWHDPF